MEEKLATIEAEFKEKDEVEADIEVRSCCFFAIS